MKSKYLNVCTLKKIVLLFNTFKFEIQTFEYLNRELGSEDVLVLKKKLFKNNFLCVHWARSSIFVVVADIGLIGNYG